MPALLWTGAALAHPGHGSGGWLSASLQHLLSEPDHLAALLGPLVAGVGVVAWRLARRRRGKED
jgi:hydrogenase/urease accessory protein HupE